MSKTFISVEGHAELIRDKATFEDHWTPDLEVWFPQGIDTPSIVLIKVHAQKIRWWSGTDTGVLSV